MIKDYFDIKNEYFFDFLDDLFQIRKAKKWEDISKNITLFKIKRTYRVFAELFPRKIDYMTELEKCNTKFSSIHWGELKGRKILDEVVRFSLYSENIIVFHPLQNPAVTNQNLDPSRNPKYWLPDFLDALYFYVVIQKWVRLGIVKLIINPYVYDLNLRDKIDAEAKHRVQKSQSKEIKEVGLEMSKDHMAEQLGLSYKGKSRAGIVKSLLEIKQPIFNEIQAQDMADRILAAIPKLNPLYNGLNIPLVGRMVNPIKGGGPIESILLISEKTQGHIYTPSEFGWNIIKEIGNKDFWTKAGSLYSKIPLNFLNNVDTNFVLELRREERLSGVRTQLKKIYSELDSLETGQINESKINELQNEFKDEVKKAEAEWKEIKKQAEMARKYWLGANIATPIIANDFTILPLSALSLIWLYTNERSTKEKEKLQKIKNPISVYVDLKNQRQSFFSVLKNSLI